MKRRFLSSMGLIVGLLVVASACNKPRSSSSRLRDGLADNVAIAIVSSPQAPAMQYLLVATTKEYTNLVVCRGDDPACSAQSASVLKVARTRELPSGRTLYLVSDSQAVAGGEVFTVIATGSPAPTIMRRVRVNKRTATATGTMASTLHMAPPSFAHRGGMAIFVDVQRSMLELNFDIGAKAATGVAKLSFYARERGFPILDLVPDKISSVRLNGAEVLAQTQVVSAPGGETRLRVLGGMVEANSGNVVEITYQLTQGVGFEGGAVQAGFFMGDLQRGGRGFWEQYAPANLEFDQFQQDVRVRISGATKKHLLFANGDVVVDGASGFNVRYPEYFNTSSFYFHLFEEGRFQVRQEQVNGMTHVIPVTTYAASAGNADSGMQNAKRYIGELEQRYGPYAHKYYIAYITPGGGGMEHAGATMTSLGAQRHETIHFWFARGVMPANGAAGWIDESIASWGNGGSSMPTDRSPVNMVGLTPYMRHTDSKAYTQGQQLIKEFDSLFAAQGGMKTILARFFTMKSRQVIDVQMFQSYLEGIQPTLTDKVRQMFQKYAFGNKPTAPSSLTTTRGFSFIELPATNDELPDVHPRPYTREEMDRLR